MKSLACVSIWSTTIFGLIVSLGGCEQSLIGSGEQSKFDVLDFGAAGDGKQDDAQAFKSAWKAACGAGVDNVKIFVPGGKNYLVFPVIFQGPCKSSKINFLIWGNIVAPSMEEWNKGPSGYMDEWLFFTRVDGLVVNGNGQGTIDGQGASWWRKGSADSRRPSALRFSWCNNLKLKSLTHKNSPRSHVSINNCTKVEVANVRMEAPEHSPNTDGIDIGGSFHVNVHDSNITTGDDCIAINGGTFNVNISRIRCGPGHGISVGSLGRNGSKEAASNINVTDCTFNRTLNGVRIKTFQGGSGFAKNIIFSNITFVESYNPVIIDQYYCPDGGDCPQQDSAVQISNVKYIGLRGTSIDKKSPVNLLCSRTVSCNNIVLQDIAIEPAGPEYPYKAICINVEGTLKNITSPDCSCITK